VIKIPATKLSVKAEAQKELDRLIWMYISANRTNVARCALRSKMGQATLYRRLEHLDDFTLSELARLRAALGIPGSELMEALRPRL